MRIRIEAFSVQKDGNAPAENEDACAPADGGGPREPVLHAAVADGATESLFSGHWARLLAGAFASGEVRDARGLLAALPGLQARWHQHVAGKSLPWYAEEKLRDGAFATLLGVRVDAGTWSALAVGDSCLFQLREGRLSRSFPLEQSAAFGASPFLLSTHVHQNARVEPQVRTAAGDLREGDTLLLMTDALACWFLAEHERGRAPWAELPGSLEAFSTFLGRLRREKVIRNDDCTLMRLSVEA
ncbi:hypothetical protein HPC49_26945 [Pyxidicoccus fallax]|uniref:Protein phosphatase 2C domain-containing protein n=1 Tax=Pyxidicoccus fallax TaxID=394095 RepID=A0A848LGN2_9BACT|nr:protein phosphatase 2C domain-containing protein [Pyxidicoccus fallax]NMO15871.1 protein phosphatase 2C domain-containing protein [Pyxidicoccus fallax]NPC81842.1 hypothetical protein [Pyxidicoccus fallax]